MTAEMENKIAKIISDNILTPIIYLIQMDEVLDCICFCDRNITMQEIYNVEKMIKEETGQRAEIIDIREFSEADRLDVISNAKLIHSEHPLIENIFTQSMAEDYKKAMNERLTVIDRLLSTGTVYLQ